MSLAAARALADAVLMEGYALYPYRASAPKNQYRWTFGVLAPRAWSQAGGCEPWWLEAQLLVAGASAALGGQLRFFQIDRRRLDGAAAGWWDEGILRTVELPGPAEPADRCELGFAFDRPWPIAGRIAIRREQLDAGRPLARVTLRVENLTRWEAPDAPRQQALLAAFASCHLLVEARGGQLLSAIDPPAWAAAVPCRSVGTYPVLVGAPGQPDAMLCAPFIMQDHPRIAPESAGDLCDATEIDELLVLRTRALTDGEKREARATDPRAAAIVDRADGMSPAALARLHGAARDLSAGEMVPRAPLAPGSKVRLRPPTRPADAQDLLYVGRVATVAKIRHDVDGTVFVAVTIDDDPAAELNRWYGRFHHYRLDEVEPL